MFKNAGIWISIGLGFFLIFQTFFDSGKSNIDVVPYSEFLSELQKKNISDVTIKGWNISGTFSNGAKFLTHAPFDRKMIDRILKHDVKLLAAPEEDMSTFMKIVLGSLPTFLLIGVWLLVLRQSGGNRALGFGRSRAKLYSEKETNITFDNVAGVNESKESLKEIIDFLKDPQKYHKIGAKIPRGVLLVGPPGTGKTLLAKAVAGEANVPFFSISGSDFVEMFVGVGASRVRDMFEQARKNAPCILFIDEIDAVGRHRGVGYGGGNDEREQTLNQLLVEMDGFEDNQAIIVVAATNRLDVLDPALLRPGRFDRHVHVPNPDIVGRKAIILVHTKKIPLADDFDVERVAQSTPGFSGADLANLVNEAALLTAKNNLDKVSMMYIEQARDKILMGAEMKSRVVSEEDRKLVAYHEGGHALIAYIFKDIVDPIHKATIVPRGDANGMVMCFPDKDVTSLRKDKIICNVYVALGGRAAEELIFGEEKVTTGAVQDFRAATSYVLQMIKSWGMNEKLGHMYYDNPSQETATKIEEETRSFIEDAYKKTKDLLKKNKKKLEIIAKNLLEKETLTGSEINELLDDKPKVEIAAKSDVKSPKTESEIKPEIKPEIKLDDI
jgi:cell division protease FtsH